MRIILQALGWWRWPRRALAQSPSGDIVVQARPRGGDRAIMREDNITSSQRPRARSPNHGVIARGQRRRFWTPTDSRPAWQRYASAVEEAPGQQVESNFETRRGGRGQHAIRPASRVERSLRTAPGPPRGRRASSLAAATLATARESTIRNRRRPRRHVASVGAARAPDALHSDRDRLRPRSRASSAMLIPREPPVAPLTGSEIVSLPWPAYRGASSPDATVSVLNGPK